MDMTPKLIYLLYSAFREEPIPLFFENRGLYLFFFLFSFYQDLVFEMKGLSPSLNLIHFPLPYPSLGGRITSLSHAYPFALTSEKLLTIIFVGVNSLLSLFIILFSFFFFMIPPLL